VLKIEVPSSKFMTSTLAAAVFVHARPAACATKLLALFRVSRSIRFIAVYAKKSNDPICAQKKL
jgi:hypothetical protein